jgi:hypothetical protein
MRKGNNKFNVGETVVKFVGNHIYKKKVVKIVERSNSTSDAYHLIEINGRDSLLSMDFVENLYMLESEAKNKHPEYYL